MNFWLKNGRLFDGKKFLDGRAVGVKDGRVAAIAPENEIPGGDKTLDLDGNLLLPGLLDLQIYGGDGLLFADNMSIEALDRIERHIVSTGTTGFLITIPSRPFDDIREAVRVVRAFMPRSRGALRGLHVEGPYLNVEKRGAHRADWIKRPEKHEIDWLVQEARDVVRFITLAPEHVDDETIKRLSQAGIVLSAGHSATTYERYREAFEAGVTHVTHLFNAMPGLEGRKPALMGALSDANHFFSKSKNAGAKKRGQGGVWVSVIADGQHSYFPSLRLAKKMFGNRLYLITDAVTATERLHLKNGAYFNELDILTGSALTMPQAIANCVREQVCPLEEALRMASAYPAAVMGWEKTCGSIRMGTWADFTVLDGAGSLRQVILRGKT